MNTVSSAFTSTLTFLPRLIELLCFENEEDNEQVVETADVRSLRLSVDAHVLRDENSYVTVGSCRDVSSHKWRNGFHMGLNICHGFIGISFCFGIVSFQRNALIRIRLM
jgi:hypothetical protein